VYNVFGFEFDASVRKARNANCQECELIALIKSSSFVSQLHK